jgi:hypothetical protein
MAGSRSLTGIRHRNSEREYLASSASVAARPTRGDDVLEDHGGSILCPRDHPRPVETNSVSKSSSGRRFTTTFSPRSSRCSQSVQRRNTSTSLGKRDRISVSDSGRSAFFFPPAPRLDCRSWLSQTGISLPSGALRSWWIRLELNPVAPAILRIDRPG